MPIEASPKKEAPSGCWTGEMYQNHTLSTAPSARSHQIGPMSIAGIDIGPFPGTPLAVYGDAPRNGPPVLGGK